MDNRRYRAECGCLLASSDREEAYWAILQVCSLPPLSKQNTNTVAGRCFFYANERKERLGVFQSNYNPGITEIDILTFELEEAFSGG